MKLSDNIQLLRKQNLLFQEELAEKCSVSRQAIAKWENSISIPSIDKLIILADTFDVTLDQLVGRESLDLYSKFKKYIYTHKAADIPTNKEDDISAIVIRYLKFAERMNLEASEILKGLEEIFLTD